MALLNCSTQGRLLARGRREFPDDIGRLSRPLGDDLKLILDELRACLALMSMAHGVRDEALRLGRRLLRPQRERPHLLRHHREAAAHLARARASTAALRANRFVWKATSLISLMIWAIQLRGTERRARASLR